MHLIPRGVAISQPRSLYMGGSPSVVSMLPSASMPSSSIEQGPRSSTLMVSVTLSTFPLHMEFVGNGQIAFPPQPPPAIASCPRLQPSRKRGASAPTQGGGNHPSHSRNKTILSPATQSPMEDHYGGGNSGESAPALRRIVDKKPVNLALPTFEEDDDVDSKEDEELLLEDLTTIATKFSMHVKTPSTYVKS